MHRSIGICALICLLIALLTPATAAPLAAPSLIKLRRAAFDPLQQPAPVARAAASASYSSLRLVQLAGPPNDQTAAQLRAAGATIIGYVPEHTLLVREATPASTQRLSNVRWQGDLLPDFKRAPELDNSLAAGGVLSLLLLGTPDTPIAPLETAVVSLGGLVRERHSSGHQLVIQIEAQAIDQLLARDDVLWVEPALEAETFNDQARRIMQVEAARQIVPGLAGSGQIVAVGDTGLDIQASVLANGNPDFPASKIVAAANLCPGGGDWTDRVGHGTHVAGAILGASGFSPSRQFAGVAPDASLVLQSLSPADSNQNSLCSSDAARLLRHAYNHGARIYNASWGYSRTAGAYTATSSEIDSFVWQHPDQLVVVAAGNDGVDCLPLVAGSACGRDGVIDPGSITAPGTAKNVLTVGASESERRQFGDTWGSEYARRKSALGEPLASDLRSNNSDGMAAFSSRGPTDDGRLKPEIVAPGVNIASASSHTSTASYSGGYTGPGLHYAYESGTSMATPLISGAAALVRQWLATERGMTEPSAALVKALLLNGAVDLAPGQYGSGSTQEIPVAWPNNVQGWGRANLAAVVEPNDARLLVDDPTGLKTGQEQRFELAIAAQQSIRLTLTWSDPPALPNAAKTLINDLDVELLDPAGQVVAQGNAAASLAESCRVAGADRCNNSEAIAFTADHSGTYAVRVRGALVPGTAERIGGPQAFALVVGAAAPTTAPTALHASTTTNVPGIVLAWDPLPGSTRYEFQIEALDRPDQGMWSAIATASTYHLLVDPGSYRVQLRGCNANGCGPFSAPIVGVAETPPWKVFAPVAQR